MLNALNRRGAPAKYQVSGVENLQVILPPIAGGDGVTPGPATDEVALPLAGKTEVKMPQSVNLDFQTGLSEKYRDARLLLAATDHSKFLSLSTRQSISRRKKAESADAICQGV